MKCNNLANFRYTWPGKHEAYTCIEHVVAMKMIADVMGFELQLIPLTVKEYISNPEISCSQEITEQEKEHGT